MQLRNVRIKMYTVWSLSGYFLIWLNVVLEPFRVVAGRLPAFGVHGVCDR